MKFAFVYECDSFVLAFKCCGSNYVKLILPDFVTSRLWKYLVKAACMPKTAASKIFSSC